MAIEHKTVERDGVRLSFVRAEVAEENGFEETSLRPQDIPLERNRWASFNVYVRDETKGQEWVLVKDRLSPRELVTFALGADYVRRVDFALPMHRGDISPFWLGWDYNEAGIFGEALTAQKVMAHYHRVVKNGLS